MSHRLSELVALLEARAVLREIVPGADAGAGDPDVQGVAIDSRGVTPGAIFAAARGERDDGHAYLDDAVAHGAGAVLVETPVAGLTVPQLVVASTRPAVAIAAAWSADFPSRHLGVVGVTGTDGKTTTSYLIRAILEASGRPTGLAGTVDVIVGGGARGNPARTTTPEAPELQALLASMVAAGDGWAVIEASSHGLAQDRVGDVAWDVGVLTNLTEEHLEFHHTIEAYNTAKRRLFEALEVGPANPEKGFGKTAVLNLDDAAAGGFAAAARVAGAAVIGYGEAAAAAVRLTGARQDAHRLHVGVRTPRWHGELAMRLAGRFNAANTLAAVAVGEALDLEPAAVRAGPGGRGPAGWSASRRASRSWSS
jgi:UDP-N-acetylmuramoyl-L-alanyl-D-glutamate--2,6-diaminopimelate ligase